MRAAAAGFMQGLAGGMQTRRDALEREEDRRIRQAEIGGFTGLGGEPAAAETYAMPTGDAVSRLRQGMIDRGLPAHVADGFIMNMKDESGFRASVNEAAPIVPGSRGGYGLLQWTGPRRTGYEGWAAKHGRRLDDENAQLDWLMVEGAGPEKAAWDAIMATKTAGEAGSVIAEKFLRPAPEHLRRRVAAYSAYDQQPKTWGALRKFT